MQLKIDVSLDQDQGDETVDVVTLESNCPPGSSSSSSDRDILSGSEHIQLVSPITPLKVFRSAGKRFSNLPFAEMLPFHDLFAVTKD